MPTESIDTAVRMVGHLLEHNGITGQYFADQDGRATPSPDDPATCCYCLVGAIETVSYRLGFSTGYWRDDSLRTAIRTALGRISLINAWEGDCPGRPTTPEQRLAIARRLQCYGI